MGFANVLFPHLEKKVTGQGVDPAGLLLCGMAVGMDMRVGQSGIEMGRQHSHQGSAGDGRG